ncbi:MAG: hypothetical protein GX230_00085 [Lentisphaerae bacterium]|jgi:hypothetical protein|nr:hypothetical protein [Lentisphaerota bacterium]
MYGQLSGCESLNGIVDAALKNNSKTLANQYGKG